MTHRNIETIPKLKMSPEQWKAERRKGIGGSDAGAILGLNPWKTRIDVWCEKTGRKTGEIESNVLHWGNLLEPVVAREYTRLTGRRTFQHNYIRKSGVLIGNVDRLVVDTNGRLPTIKGQIITSRLLECKTARDKRQWDDGVPAHYLAQAYHYMALCPTVKIVDVAVFFKSDSDFAIFSVERDDAYIDSMCEVVTEFWERYVVTDTPPDPTCEADCKTLWRQSQSKSVQETPDISIAVKRYREAQQAEATATDDKQKWKDRITVYMRDADTLTTPEGRKVATWKSSKDGTVTDWQAVSEALKPTDPEQLKHYEETVARHTTAKLGTRSFRLTEQKE